MDSKEENKFEELGMEFGNIETWIHGLWIKVGDRLEQSLTLDGDNAVAPDTDRWNGDFTGETRN